MRSNSPSSGLLKTCLLFLSIALITGAAAQQAGSFSLSALRQGQSLQGFSATAVYLNDAGQSMGARFTHERTGFVLDLLQIESVPQTFIWVNTWPLSDKGEPHTQEHLLVTKGFKGHELNTREGMSLATSNAFTAQLHTAYDFYTGASGATFYQLFEGYLDALLNPDYTNEEVHREVCNWGVSEDAATKLLHMEEKGSVYNEMKTSMVNPYSQLFDSMGRLLYGNAHPLSFNAGGLPADIRILHATDIKQYHDRFYHLSNMGAITSVPKAMALIDVLAKTNEILNRLQPQATREMDKQDLPPFSPAAAGTIRIAEYPNNNAQESGSMFFAFPANRQLDATETILMNTFLSVVAGDPSTNLYKKFIDGNTRELNLGAQGVFGYVDNNKGQAVVLGVTDIAAPNLTEEKAVLIRSKIIEELTRIASFKDNSPELKEFNTRVRNSLTNQQRGLAKFTNTPPKFGFRNTGDDWYNQLMELAKIPSFRKSVILKPQFADVLQQLDKKTNFWKTYLSKWKLLDEQPYVIVSKANPQLIEKDEKAAAARATEEIARLKNVYQVSDDQEAIRRYKADYDSTSAALEKAEQASTIRFIDNPPLSLDEELDFKQTTLPGNIRLATANFANMTSATTGIALRLDEIPADKLMYLAMFPQLLRETGVIKNGKAVTYEEMTQQLRREILDLDCQFNCNYTTSRAELVIKGAGNNAAESKRAVEWMRLILQSPNWTTGNLPRLRDLADQQFSDMRKRMQNAEENWVWDPAQAYYGQDKPLLLATFSFLTQSYNIFRLRWMLRDAGDGASQQAIITLLDNMAAYKGDREQRKKLLAIIQASHPDSLPMPAASENILSGFRQASDPVQRLARDVAKDLEQMLNDIPDESLQGDWAYLCHQLKKDLLQSPQQTLANLDVIRKLILKKANTRLFMTGSPATRQQLVAPVNSLLTILSSDKPSRVSYANTHSVIERLKKRLNTSDTPVFVGLINPNSQTGVFINFAPLATYADTSREMLLRFLASKLYAGGGKQSVFTKSTGAGLSYSSGVGSSPGTGQMFYYAERTPLLPQTIQYIIDEIKRSPYDPSLSEYVIAMSVSSLRSASDYEVRGEAMAQDIADGITPQKIRAFREALLRLRKMPGLMEEVYKRKDQVYETVFPGYGIKEGEVKGGIYFVIGPEKQMIAYESYLQSKEGAGTKLYRLYPRDYWTADE